MVDDSAKAKDKPTAAANNGNDEEARLKDKLEGKKTEKDLKNKLLAKKERRNSENGDEPSKKESPRNRERRSSSSPNNNSNGRYVVPQRRGGGGPDHGRGPPPDRRGGGNRGSWRGGGDRYYDDRDSYGRGPPPGPPPDRFRRDNHFRDDFGRGPPHPRFGVGGGNHFYEEDPFGRAPRRHYQQQQQQQQRSRSRSRSPRSYSSRSRSLSRSYSRSRSPRSRSRSESRNSGSNKRGRSQDRGRRGSRKHRRRSRTSRRSRSPSTSGSSISSSSSSSSSSSEESHNDNDDDDKKTGDDAFTKDQRTVFVNQLIMRTTAKDIKRYFRRKVQAKVIDVELLTDRRTGKHKGCAYVEMKSMEDVTKALGASGQAPDFQRFPIMIKPSEAEKNYLVPASSMTATASTMMGPASAAKAAMRSQHAPIMAANGDFVESQKVYVGSLDATITQEHLYKLFSQFGDLKSVQLQMDPGSGISKGFAFLSFRDPKEANLAIQTMSNQVLGGRPMKTGWATQPSTTPGVQVVTSEEFPIDASARAQKAHIALAQLAIGAASSIGSDPTSASTPTSASKVPTVAEARHNLAASAASGILGAASTPTSAAVSTPTALPSSPAADAKTIGRAENPTPHLLISNMFDKDEETEVGWADDIKEEFQEECSQFGKIENVLVMSKDPGGKIYASFDSVEAAKNCASSLAGRWFDKRQLRVEFVDGSSIPKEA